MNKVRFHVGVQDIEASTRFYTAVFGLPPAVRDDDYARWEMDKPPVQFAISSRTGSNVGFDHLADPVESSAERNSTESRVDLGRIDSRTVAESRCLHANRDRHRAAAPAGIAFGHGESGQNLAVASGDSAVDARNRRDNAVCCAR